jgi:DnaA family protein
MPFDMTQLSLDLKLQRHTRFGTFVADSNASVLAHLQESARGSRHETLWLWGGENAGKTHLLQAACREAGECQLRSIYLAADRSQPAEALAGLGSLDFVAIDDVSNLAGDAEQERALFAVVNDFYRGAGTLLMASSGPPSAAGFELADLASRAAGAIVYRLLPLSDEARLSALERLAHSRGLELDSPTASFLLARVRRDMRSLSDWLDILDRESLAAKRKITIPFVRDLLARTGTDMAPETGGEK